MRQRASDAAFRADSPPPHIRTQPPFTSWCVIAWVTSLPRQGITDQREVIPYGLQQKIPASPKKRGFCSQTPPLLTPKNAPQNAPHEIQVAVANPSRPADSVQLVTFINRERIKIGTGVAVLTDQWEQLRPRDRIAQAVAEQVNGRVGVVSEHEQFSVGVPQGQFNCRVTHCNVPYHKMSTQEGLT